MMEKSTQPVIHGVASWWQHVTTLTLASHLCAEVSMWLVWCQRNKSLHPIRPNTDSQRNTTRVNELGSGQGQYQCVQCCGDTPLPTIRAEQRSYRHYLNHGLMLQGPHKHTHHHTRRPRYPSHPTGITVASVWSQQRGKSKQLLGSQGSSPLIPHIWWHTFRRYCSSRVQIEK